MERPEIQKMPDKETLEEFLSGLHQPPTIVFNREKGEFERVRPKPLEEQKENEIISTSFFMK